MRDSTFPCLKRTATRADPALAASLRAEAERRGDLSSQMLACLPLAESWRALYQRLDRWLSDMDAKQGVLARLVEFTRGWPYDGLWTG